MLKPHYKYLILGAGPAGLGAAYRLKEIGETDFLVLEKSDHAGGLASSFTDEKGFLWDVGGHVHFSHYPYYDQALNVVLGKDAFVHHARHTHIWLNGRLIPYPFQNNLYALPIAERWQCLLGLWKASLSPKKSSVQNFHDWAAGVFGAGIMKIFFQPYNEKVWARPLEQLDTAWMGERVASVNLWEATKNTLFKIDQSSWGPNSAFRYPKVGGTGSLWRSMAKYVGDDFFRFNAAVAKINVQSKTVYLATGEKIQYDNLLSTISLRVLGKIAEGLDEETIRATEKLCFSSSHLVGIGLQGRPPQLIEKMSWLYFPEKEIPYYRATLLSNYAPSNVSRPDEQWSLLLEISESEFMNTGLDNVVEKTIEALLRTQFIVSKKDILSRWYLKEEFGYPIPHIGRDNALKQIHPVLEKSAIYSRGRFGGWKYEVSNQDHTFMQGVELVNRLEQGVSEKTYVVSS